MDIETIAHYIGTHAVVLLAFGIVSMLCMTAIVWHLLKRYGESWWHTLVDSSVDIVRAITNALPPNSPLRYNLAAMQTRTQQFIRENYFVIHALIGFCIAFFAAFLFIEFSEEINRDDIIGRFDIALSKALRAAIEPQTYTFFAFVTHFGDKLTLAALGLCVAAFLIQQKHWLLLGGWALSLLGNGLLNTALKTFFHRTRPWHDHGFTVTHGWSFPSGHSSGALVAYGMLAYLTIRHTDRVWHLPITLLAITVIQVVGGSRIILQVHYFTDVAAGFCSGGAWLAICIAGIEIASRHQRIRSTSAQ